MLKRTLVVSAAIWLIGGALSYRNPDLLLFNEIAVNVFGSLTIILALVMAARPYAE